MPKHQTFIKKVFIGEMFDPDGVIECLANGFAINLLSLRDMKGKNGSQ
jgi:hypothetical protein